MSEKEVNITIANRLANAHDKIANAAQKSNRISNEIKLMAVSKTKSIQEISAAYHAGQRIFGENYAQELAEKVSSLADLPDIEWHFIGPIQSNKTALISASANWVDSVDREKVARRLSKHASELKKQLNILIQVNISQSQNKSGIALNEVSTLAKIVADLPGLTLRGLMAIPDVHQDEQLLINEFNQMNTCFSELSANYDSIDTLSLGMSEDLDVAIQCGSTLVRLGTAIFGPRE